MVGVIYGVIYVISRFPLFSQMCFPVLLFLAILSFSKDSTGMGANSVLTDLLTPSKPSKHSGLDDPHKVEKRKKRQDQLSRVVVPIRWYSFWPGTDRCFANLVLFFFRHAQTFVDNLSNTVFFMPSWPTVIPTVNRRLLHTHSKLIDT